MNTYKDNQEFAKQLKKKSIKNLEECSKYYWERSQLVDAELKIKQLTTKTKED